MTRKSFRRLVIAPIISPLAFTAVFAQTILPPGAVITLKPDGGASVVLPVVNRAPVASAIPDQSATEGAAFSFVVPAFTDPDGDALTYAAIGNPAWLAFNAATRTFSGTPLVGSAGTYSVTVTASDGQASVSDSFDVVASPASSVPTIPLSASFTTPAGEAFLRSCVSAPYPVHPPQWEWDPSTFIKNQPQSATREMRLTPKVEQYRNEILIATYDRIGGNALCNVPNRSDNPGTPKSVACGPFSPYGPPSFKHGDVFKVYPAVYKEAVYLGPVPEGTFTVAATAGSNIATVASTKNLTEGSSIVSLTTFLPFDTKVVSINSPTQITLNKPFLLSGSVSLKFFRANKNITIEGVTQDVGGRPTRPAIVYDNTFNGAASLGKGMLYLYGAGGSGDIENLTWRNIDLLVKKPPEGVQFYMGPHPWALVYAGSGLLGTNTFEDTRFMGSMYVAPGPGSGGNGVLTGNPNPTRTKQNSGILRFNRTEFGDNGGIAGPAHNAYLGEGADDWTVELTNSYLHDVVDGHLWKTRALRNIIKGNYFKGGEGGPHNQYNGESFSVNAASGGDLIAVDNIFVKNSAGSNGVTISYNEGNSHAYTWKARENKTIDIRNNTFVAFAQSYDNAQFAHAQSPFFMFGTEGFRKRMIPGDKGFPTPNWTIANNVFIGYCPRSQTTVDGRIHNFPFVGQLPTGVGPQITAGHSDINLEFGLTTNYVPLGDNSIIGEREYVHYLNNDTRQLATFGAKDASTGTASPPSVPHVFLRAEDYQIKSRGSTTLRWAVTGATSCEATGGWSGTKGILGSENISANETTAYTLTCTGPSGIGVDSVTVEAIGVPTASITASPNPINKGQRATISWSSTKADYCIGYDAMGPFPVVAESSRDVNPAASIVYGLACVGAGGTSTRAQTLLTVNGTVQLPTVNLVARPHRISKTQGNKSSLGWDSTGANSCTGTGFDTNNATSGMVEVQPLVRTSYSVSCIGPGGTSPTRTFPITVDP